MARRMYEIRFPDDVTEGLNMEQLRGHEGARVRQAYRDAADKYGIEWDRRSYKPQDFDASNDANQALTAATACLYGVTQAVTVALGLSPGLGFVHVGHDRSFVYDVADLYKTEIAVPVAFEVVSRKDVEDIPAETRRAMRDAMFEAKLLTRCVKDIHKVLGADGSEDDNFGWDVVELWDDKVGTVESGKAWDQGTPW